MAFYTWHKIADPGTGWFASKTTGWTADSFSGGLEVDFSAEVPPGAKAVRVFVLQQTTVSSVFFSIANDTDHVSNTPNAGTEYSHQLMTSSDSGKICVIWLSSDYKADFAVTNTGTDLYISYPLEVLL